jgi:hypothetical protein
MSVYPYALLQPNPTTEIGISWIDDTGNGGDTQTVSYRTANCESAQTESDDGAKIINSGNSYIYHTTLTALEPATQYSITIESSETVEHTFETMPEAMPDCIRFAATSDHHPWREGIGMAAVGRGPAVMEELGQLDFDLILSPGDALTHVQNATRSDAEDWLTWWSDYGRPMDQEKLHPRFRIPGNHEVAQNIPQTWNGRKQDWDDAVVSPNAGHFHQFFPNIQAVEPVGQNYGAITVSDYLQIIGLDTYSAFPADQTEWLEDTIDDSVDHCIPVIHTPLLPGANRGNDELNKTIRQEWAKPLSEPTNTRFTIVGDNHCRKYTYPWQVVDSKPSHDEYFDLDGDGYLVIDETERDPSRMCEYGDGWPIARDANPTDGEGNTVTWYLEYTEFKDQTEANIYTIALSNADDNIQVREWDQWGTLLESHII